MYNNTHFPYPVQGPAPPLLHKAGEVLDQCSKANSYAISFDDGPGQLSDELLDYLEEQQLKVTFFMNGDNWSCIYGKKAKKNVVCPSLCHAILCFLLYPPIESF